MKTLVLLTIIGSLLLTGFSAAFPRFEPEPIAQRKTVADTAAELNTVREEIKTPVEQPAKEINMFAKEVTVHSEIESTKGQGDSMNRTPGRPLFTFTGSEPSWYTVNDSVMGGISSSTARFDPQSENLTFSGNVSLENNGGFASTRSDWTGHDLHGYDRILMRVRGDGNVYRLRTRTERTGSEVAYTALFETAVDEWQEVYIPFAEMIPTYRGFVVSAAGPLDPASIRSFGFMVTDKQQGQFFLEVDWINAVAVKRNESTLASKDAAFQQVPSLVYADG